MAGKDEAIDGVHSFIKENDDFFLIYHLDTDGITSAALVSKALDKIGKKIVGYRPTNYEDFKGLDLSAYPANVIVCDMQIRKENMEVFSGKKLCVIDHHELNAENSFPYVNPKMWGDMKYRPCAFVVYQVFKQHLKGDEWIAAIGTVGDSGGKDNREFLLETSKNIGAIPGKDEYFYDTDFGIAAEMIGDMTTRYGRTGAEEALGIVLLSNSMRDILSNQRLLSAKKTVDTELKRLRETFKSDAERPLNNLILFELDPKYRRYSSTLITSLSFDKEYYGNILVFITKIKDNLLRLNLRANGVDIKLPEILREIFQKIPGEGGGHDKASGGTIEEKDKEEFKRLLVDAIKKRFV
jgi:single-stranded DNA-specific DHH superfamily exonuclease